MDKTKLTNHQLFALTANFTIGTTILSGPAGAADLAKQDAWICALISPLFGLLFVWMYSYLGKLYPNKTLIDIIQQSFNKWVGWLVSLFFILFVCFLDVAQVMSYVSGFMQTEYMTETPLYAFNIAMLIVLAIGLLYGIEAIARSSEFFLYIVVVALLLSLVFVSPNIKVENALPVLEGGVVPVLKGCLYLSSYMTWPLIVINMIYPINIDNTQQADSAIFKGYLLGALIDFLFTAVNILVLGATITARSQYPTYLLVKEIDIGIITRIEGVVSGAWIVTQFIKTLIYFYAGLTAMVQLFGLKDYKKFVLPLSLVLLVLSGIVYPNVAYQLEWDSITWVPFIGTFGGLLPVLLLVSSAVKSIKMRMKILNSQQ